MSVVRSNAGVATFAQPIAPSPNFAFPWTPDCGDGTYLNPVIHADYSDPDVIRVDHDFYLVSSSFNCTPGLPILHSRDLVNWKIINHAVKNLPHPRYEEVQPGCGIWAPSIRFHAGKFWVFFPMPDEGIYLTTAKDPLGEWSEPHLVQEGRGLIDPCPLWDDDGKAYLVHAYAHSRSGIKHILRVRPMAPDGSKLLGEGKIVFHEPERHPTIEGPKFLKRNGWYYISAPAGGVETGWQTVLRSRNIYGPYEDKIVLQQGSTSVNGPHQGALLDTPDGNWWFVHFQDADLYGRIVHLQPVTWQDDWPLIGARENGGDVGEPVAQFAKPVASNGSAVIPQTSDEFNSDQLGLQWQWQANHKESWYELDKQSSRLRLYPQWLADGNLIKAPNLLLQKFPARSFVAETQLKFEPQQAGEEAGIMIAGDTHAALGLKRINRANQIVIRINGREQVIQDKALGVIQLRIKVTEQGLCQFSFACDNGWETVPHIFPAKKGKWIGAKIGLYSVKSSKEARAGHVDVDYFRFHGQKLI
jgi:beta-xylosidase